MRAYIAISYHKRYSLKEQVKTIVDHLQTAAFEPFVFADHYQFPAEEEKLMMEKAFFEIDRCDFLIAEVSEKAIGVGVEVGYAKAKSKPIIYIRSVHASHSTTISGTCDYSILYSNLDSLATQLTECLKEMWKLYN